MNTHVLESLYVTRTYAGWYAGAPSPESIVAGAKTQAIQLWGDRPTLVLEAPIRVWQTPRAEHRMLPPWRFLLWLNGPAMATGCGSHLVVIAFGSEPLFDAKIFVDQINWAKHAEDWDP
jgi:hypothetical protein